MEREKTITHYEENPITISIKNPTNEQKKWVLFGTNVFLHEDNFGSDEGLKIENNGNYSYQSILQDLSSKKIPISMLRIMTDVKVNFNQCIYFEKITNSTKEFSSDKISEHLDRYQFQSDIIQMPCSLFLDKEHTISGKIEPNSQMIFSFYCPKSESEEKTKSRKIIKKEYFLLRMARNIYSKTKTFKTKLLTLIKINKHGK